MNDGMNITNKVSQILRIFAEMYPDAECSLDEDGDSFHLVVRAVLSAQCTDKRVNAVTKTLFRDYPDPEHFACESEQVIGERIRSCGLYKTKAHALVVSSQMIINEFGGQIPSDRKNLERLPGVGRKVANLILGEIYGIPSIVVDTHCGRVAKRLGLTKSDSPLQIEKDLMACIPKENWITLGHRFVAHGRLLCTARNPKCPDCPVREVCTYAAQISNIR
jgi:endonuclease-3